MLAAKRSAGVAPEVNRWNLLHAGNEARKQEIHPGFETLDRRHQKSKTGVSVAPQKGLMSSKKILKKSLPFFLGEHSSQLVSWTAPFYREEPSSLCPCPRKIKPSVVK